MKSASSYEQSLEEFLKVKEAEESRLLEPIGEGKWSIRDIIGHLYYWDRFIVTEHVPFMAQGTRLIAFPDHDLHNKEAIAFISRFDTIHLLLDEFVRTRKQLLQRIRDIGTETRFSIGSGKRQFTADSYLAIFVKHDIHHLKQINNKLS
ncbi:DinB family protein [Paenibacillus sp. NPDC058174]|uniref:DinB family protein n=1 Tax=Paenibacillus sp. NPDC058174 TaxID=3346366 RepID=UPI0036D8B89A